MFTFLAVPFFRSDEFFKTLFDLKGIITCPSRLSQIETTKFAMFSECARLMIHKVLWVIHNFSHVF